ncbi:MAG: hypothetical protein HKP01_08040, partial [Gemmatimonadetes bacterium]|nr:hypothetical protein [Gemmatimonadota bacterium]
EEAIPLARRIAGPQIIRGDQRVLPFVQQDRIYWTARAQEDVGALDEAILGYERLQGMAGDGLRQIPWMADTAERLARLKEAGASRGEP